MTLWHVNKQVAKYMYICISPKILLSYDYKRTLGIYQKNHLMLIYHASYLKCIICKEVGSLYDYKILKIYSL